MESAKYPAVDAFAGIVFPELDLVCRRDVQNLIDSSAILGYMGVFRE
jgi:hypothetical protein